jgi:hypothetical protein
VATPGIPGYNCGLGSARDGRHYEATFRAYDGVDNLVDSFIYFLGGITQWILGFATTPLKPTEGLNGAPKLSYCAGFVPDPRSVSTKSTFIARSPILSLLRRRIGDAQAAAVARMRSVASTVVIRSSFAKYKTAEIPRSNRKAEVRGETPHRWKLT